MRISREFGTIFLANPKCASNTVERYMHAHMRDVGAPKGLIRHVDATILDQFMADQGLSYDDFLVFTTIRNPWDRIVSLWTYAQNRPDSVWYDAAVSSKTLSEFLRTEIVHDAFVRKFGLHGFTHTPDGRCTVDDVICIERFSTELPLMFRRIGIDFEETGLHENRSERRSYQEYYDAADRRLVADLFEVDIEYGQYRF
jgi:hypothetical protein